MDRTNTAVFVVLVLSSTALSLAAWVFGIFSFDRAVEQALQGWGDPAGMLCMAWASLPGDGWLPVILAGAVCAICIIWKRWLEAGFVLATLGSTLLSGILKIMVARPRPYGAPVDPSTSLHAFNAYAYPSGHVVFYVVFFGFLAYLSWRCIRGPARAAVVAACLLLIVLIGPSRVILGEHWVSDVIGGYLLGGAWLLLQILLYERMRSGTAGGGYPELGS